MKAFLVIVAGLICVIAVIVAASPYLRSMRKEQLGTPTEWNEKFNTYELCKNPCELRGHSGILDPRFIFYKFPNGMQGAMAVPGGGLRFERMIDAQTATFEVETLGYSIEPTGELAVFLDDSHPPDVTRPWRITVEEPFEGTNGLGAKVTVSAVRFDGYVPPSEPAPQPAAAPEPQKAPAAAPSEAVTSPASEGPSVHSVLVEPSTAPTSDSSDDEAQEPHPSAGSSTEPTPAAASNSR